MRLLQRLGIFFLIASLSSCATVTNKTTTAETETTKSMSWQERETALNRIQAWQINGKIAVRTPNDSGSASVDWSQNRGSYNISLMGPLGSGGLKLYGTPNRVTLTNSKGESFTASSPEALLAKRWGFNVPVSHLKYWIRGLPAPGLAANKQFDRSNRLVALTQDGWQIQFPAYTNSGGVDLPSKVFINSASLDVKIVIYNWNT